MPPSGADIIELRFETEIRASVERIFALVADLRGYDRWLPRSSSFNGTTAISEGPIAVGTTYVEPGPFTTRHGKVVVFEPPTRIDFEQPMTSKLEALGVIGIHLSLTLTPEQNSVRVVRLIRLSPKGPVKFAMPLLVGAFKAENERVLKALKSAAEG